MALAINPRAWTPKKEMSEHLDSLDTQKGNCPSAWTPKKEIAWTIQPELENLEY